MTVVKKKPRWESDLWHPATEVCHHGAIVCLNLSGPDLRIQGVDLFTLPKWNALCPKVCCQIRSDHLCSRPSYDLEVGVIVGSCQRAPCNGSILGVQFRVASACHRAACCSVAHGCSASVCIANRVGVACTQQKVVVSDMLCPRLLMHMAQLLGTCRKLQLP